MRLKIEIMTRAEAKAKKQGMYFTGEPCKYGHIDERYVKNSNCIVCQKNRYYKNRREKKNGNH